MKKYSLLDHAIVVAGALMSGFAEGDDVVRGDRRNDAFSDIVGADGQMLVTQNADRSGTLILKFLYGSASNSILSGLFENQERGVFVSIPVSVIDTKSGTSMGGTRGYITKPAAMSKGAKAQSLEWTIVLENYEAIFTPLPEV
jgi:hypothetical protein